MGIEVGDRDDGEGAIRKLLAIPTAIICAIVFAALLKNRLPPLLGFVIGGAIGGALGFLLGEGAIRLLRLIWPPRD